MSYQESLDALSDPTRRAVLEAQLEGAGGPLPRLLDLAEQGLGGLYGVGKAAQETLFSALAQEVAGSGVTVNVVRVRAIDTAAGEGGSDKAYATSPAEISAAVRYLFSDAARVVNGERLGLHSGV